MMSWRSVLSCGFYQFMSKVIYNLTDWNALCRDANSLGTNQRRATDTADQSAISHELSMALLDQLSVSRNLHLQLLRKSGNQTEACWPCALCCANQHQLSAIIQMSVLIAGCQMRVSGYGGSKTKLHWLWKLNKWILNKNASDKQSGVSVP